MDVEDMRRCSRIRLEGNEKVLAMGDGPCERATVDQRGPVAEPPLRRRGADDLAVEQSGEGCGNAVDDVAFRHLGLFSIGLRRHCGRGSVTWPSWCDFRSPLIRIRRRQERRRGYDACDAATEHTPVCDLRKMGCRPGAKIQRNGRAAAAWPHGERGGRSGRATPPLGDGVVQCMERVTDVRLANVKVAAWRGSGKSTDLFMAAVVVRGE